MSEKREQRFVICPEMSGVVTKQLTNKPDEWFVRCQEHRCAFYIQVYTTENIPTYVCSKAYAPLIVDGQLRV